MKTRRRWRPPSWASLCSQGRGSAPSLLSSTHAAHTTQRSNCTRPTARLSPRVSRRRCTVGLWRYPRCAGITSALVCRPENANTLTPARSSSRQTCSWTVAKSRAKARERWPVSWSSPQGHRGQPFGSSPWCDEIGAALVIDQNQSFWSHNRNPLMSIVRPTLRKLALGWPEISLNCLKTQTIKNNDMYSYTLGSFPGPDVLSFRVSAILIDSEAAWHQDLHHGPSYLALSRIPPGLGARWKPSA